MLYGSRRDMLLAARRRAVDHTALRRDGRPSLNLTDESCAVLRDPGKKKPVMLRWLGLVGLPQRTNVLASVRH